MWGWSVKMKFPPVKILDFANREAELEADSNPFAKVVLAHLKALQTRGDPEARRFWKFRLVRGLYERGFQADDVRQLFRLVDWLLELPQRIDKRFWRELQDYQEDRVMPFITTPERFGIKAGMLRLIENLLRNKFGAEGAKLMPEIDTLEDADKFAAMHETIFKAATVDEVRRACAAAAAPPEPRKKSPRRKSSRGQP